MRLGDIVEGEDAPAKLEEQVRAEGDKAPERDLVAFSCWSGWSKVWRSYHRDDFLLDGCGEGDNLEEDCEVDLSTVSDARPGDMGWPTEVRRSAMEVVCWARVILAVRDLCEVPGLGVMRWMAE